MKFIGIFAGLLILAGPALAGTDTKDAPPIDRAAALKIAPKFTNEVEAALSHSMIDLYTAADGGTVHDKWVYGLALSAGRQTLDPLSPSQRALYVDYMHRVHQARAAYAKAHKDSDTSNMPSDVFVQATPDEAMAANLADRVNAPDVWLDPVRAAPSDVTPEVLAQSLACLSAVHDKVEGEDLMTQLIGSVAQAHDGGQAKGQVDIAQITAEIDKAPKSDAELDDEARCGGADAFAKDLKLMKAVYVSNIQVSVSKGK